MYIPNISEAEATDFHLMFAVVICIFLDIEEILFLEQLYS